MSDIVNITFPDGSIKQFPRGITSLSIAESISKRLAKESLAALVNEEVWDLSRPIAFDARVKLLKWDDNEGRYAFWHSSAHLMAEAIESVFPGAKFGIGPPIETGFYYDIDLGERKLTTADLEILETKMAELSYRNVPYIREEISWDAAVEYFKNKGDEYKLELLEGLKEAQVSLYHQGEFTDLCRGPHIPTTGYIKALKLLSIAGAYWRGDERNKMLQRIYGVTFPTKKELDEYLYRLEEAKKRDHRKLGQELELFMLSQKIGAGLPVWLPKGAIIREELEKFMREEQRKRGYEPVVTPHIGNLDLYRISGHYPYYKESQFNPIQVEQEEYLLKPMNCPHHHQIYSVKPRSYRDLPIRYAEFGTVYRYEQSGELNGLIRVRSFTQDDSHIYLRQDQLKEEICKVIELIQHVMSTLGFSDFTTRLSFRDTKNPQKYGGDDSLWEQAEKEIKEAADVMKLQYAISIGEAAFYGPKIDFMVKDALGRVWQLGTVQVDYVMPGRFQLEYVGSDGQKHRPVIIHRAPFGSLERFIGILIEHYAGFFPVWLSPIQAAVIPITDAQLDYAREITEIMKSQGLRIELDFRNEKVGYKIRDWEMKKVPYMAVIGEKEVSERTISMRIHKKGDLGKRSLEEFIELIKKSVSLKSIEIITN